MKSSKPPYLSVVKGGASDELIRGVENLSLGEREVVDRYVKYSNSSGVLIGAFIGQSSWDLRPILLEKGSVSMVRLTNPVAVLHRERFQALSQLFAELERERDRHGFLAWGESNGHLWYRRKFYDSTLEGHLSNEGSATVFGIQSLISEIKRLHERGIAHGHLAESNVSLVGDTAIILDFGIMALSPEPKASNLAPEILRGDRWGGPSDIFALGMIMSKHNSFNSSDEHLAFIGRMTSSEASLRPDIFEVLKVFLPESPKGPKKRSETGGLPKIVIDVPGKAAAKSTTSSISLFKKLFGPHIRTYLLVAVLVVLALVASRGGFVERFVQYFESDGSTLEFSSLWKSGQPSLMSQVAEAAIERRNRYAQAAIFDGLMTGFESPMVNSTFLRAALNPRWERNLSSDDRAAILAVGLAPLLSERISSIPPLASLNPIVPLSIVGTMGLGSEGKEFESVTLSKMAELPDPIGDAFARLESSSVPHMEHPAAKSLARILVLNDTKPETIRTFFDDYRDSSIVLARLTSILSISAMIPGLEAVLSSELASGVPPLFGWFSSFEIPGWNKFTDGERLRLFAGAFPERELSFEQMGDLLKFPLATIRQKAQEKILEKFPFGERGKELMSILGSSSNVLPRDQSLSVLSALLLKGEAGAPFFSAWFDLDPDPALVLQLLLARNEKGSIDPFSLYAARYLGKSTWSASLPDLVKLGTHPEPLARTLAYTRLDPKDPKQATILTRLAEVESNQRNKLLIEERLKSASQKD